MISDDENLL